MLCQEFQYTDCQRNAFGLLIRVKHIGCKVRKCRKHAKNAPSLIYYCSFNLYTQKQQTQYSGPFIWFTYLRDLSYNTQPCICKVFLIKFEVSYLYATHKNANIIRYFLDFFSRLDLIKSFTSFNRSLSNLFKLFIGMKFSCCFSKYLQRFYH